MPADDAMPPEGGITSQESASPTATMEPPDGTTPPAGGPPQSPDAKPAGKNPWMWVAIVLGVLLVIVAAYYFLTANEKVAVPNVVGMTQAAAAASLDDAGLKLGAISTVESDTAPAGQVISQNPEAAREVKTGSAVDLVISAGAVTVAVPDVVGSSSSDAESAISAVGLVTVTTDEYSDTVAEGSVVAQVPAAGSEAIPGDTVAISISKGKVPPKATVPDVVGKTQAEAEKSLESAGFAVKLTQAYHPTIKKGTVGAQVPDAGIAMVPGSEVEIFVSLGPGTASITVPDVIGMSESKAVDTLTAAGLKAKVYRNYSDTTAKGNVFLQAPTASSQTGAGTEVGIAVSLGTAPSSGKLAVPDVVGKSSEEASAAIIAAGLTPVEVPGFSSAAAGTVGSQSPVAGSSVPEASPVIYLVSKGPKPTP